MKLAIDEAWYKKLKAAHSDKNPIFTLSKAEISAILRFTDGQQAAIDEIMLEYCPDEMSKEQVEEWVKHQKPASPEHTKALNDQIAKWRNNHVKSN